MSVIHHDFRKRRLPVVLPSEVMASSLVPLLLILSLWLLATEITYSSLRRRAA